MEILEIKNAMLVKKTCCHQKKNLNLIKIREKTWDIRKSSLET